VALRRLLTRKDLKERSDIVKAWSRYTMRQAHIESKALHEAIKSRDNALIHLQSISKELYEKAIIPDDTPYPVQLKPPTDTPPNREYQLALERKLKDGQQK
jgi:hypothetical protein